MRSGTASPPRRQYRNRLGTGRAFFDQLRVLTQWFAFPCWTDRFETMLREYPPPALPLAAASAPI